MTITLDIGPEIQAELARQAAACGRAIETHAARLLEEAARSQTTDKPASVESKATKSQTGQSLIDACAKVQGLLTDEEVDTLFARNRSYSRPVDFE